MTRRIMPALRACLLATPAWAVHFHDDGPQGHSAACYDARCGALPLSTTDRPRFMPRPPVPPEDRPLVAARRPRSFALGVPAPGPAS
jgi:hypothetical protein